MCVCVCVCVCIYIYTYSCMNVEMYDNVQQGAVRERVLYVNCRDTWELFIDALNVVPYIRHPLCS